MLFSYEDDRLLPLFRLVHRWLMYTLASFHRFLNSGSEFSERQSGRISFGLLEYNLDLVLFKQYRSIGSGPRKQLPGRLYGTPPFSQFPCFQNGLQA